jgi:hypothetical protein
MMVIGAVGALTVNSLDLLAKRALVKGWYSGTAVDSEDTLEFSQLNGIASLASPKSSYTSGVVITLDAGISSRSGAG